jgi:hypothetical protein
MSSVIFECYIEIKICPKTFRSKRSFVKSIPGWRLAPGGFPARSLLSLFLKCPGENKSRSHWRLMLSMHNAWAQKWLRHLCMRHSNSVESNCVQTMISMYVKSQLNFKCVSALNFPQNGAQCWASTSYIHSCLWQRHQKKTRVAPFLDYIPFQKSSARGQHVPAKTVFVYLPQIRYRFLDDGFPDFEASFKAPLDASKNLEAVQNLVWGRFYETVLAGFYG